MCPLFDCSGGFVAECLVNRSVHAYAHVQAPKTLICLTVPCMQRVLESVGPWELKLTNETLG